MAGNMSLFDECRHLVSEEIEGFLICLKCGLSLDNICFEKKNRFECKRKS